MITNQAVFDNVAKFKKMLFFGKRPISIQNNLKNNFRKDAT